MPIWMSNDKELRFADMGEDCVAVNMFLSDEDLILGVMLTRDEIENLVYKLAEYCGIPFFNKGGINLNGSLNDNLSS